MKKGLQNEVYKKDFFDCFLYFFEVRVQRCPRVVPGSLQGQNWSKMGLKMTEQLSTNAVQRLSEHASQRHAIWACFQIALVLFFVFSYSCRGRFCATCVQVKSQHSSTWLGGKTYGGCLPDASQMPPRCLSDASQMPFRCFSDASRCFPNASRCFPKKTVWGLALG